MFHPIRQLIGGSNSPQQYQQNNNKRPMIEREMNQFDQIQLNVIFLDEQIKRENTQIGQKPTKASSLE
jgi:hypothetical protein